MLDPAEADVDAEIWQAMEDAENDVADEVGWEPLDEDFLEVASSAEVASGGQDGAGDTSKPSGGEADDDFALEVSRFGIAACAVLIWPWGLAVP